jgi:hypothetical protein
VIIWLTITLARKIINQSRALRGAALVRNAGVSVAGRGGLWLAGAVEVTEARNSIKAWTYRFVVDAVFSRFKAGASVPS